ncbi:MAG: 2-oxoglutarate dehydrogenase E1 component, partial [Chlamydiota bacterium]
YLTNPESVELSWRYFFEGVRLSSHFQSVSGGGFSSKALIDGYRYFGHLAAHCNPLKEPTPISNIKELQLETYGFKRDDLEVEVDTWGVLPLAKAKLKDVIKALEAIYCENIGVEIGHLEASKQAFIIQKLESNLATSLTQADKHEILKDLNRSEIFESFIHRKYPGQKRFSLEGGESLIPLFNEVLNKGANLGIEECVIGMAHRGRLNLLANIMQKSYRDIFYEFSPYYMPNTCEGSGDVKYHKGFRVTKNTKSGKAIKLELCENPSHLESVNMVVEGIVKAKQVLAKGSDPQGMIVPILIHGDASLAGQGAVYETLQLSLLEGYSVGGTLHIVINNQVGFTATEKETRSTRYCTDIAKAFDCPVFHVNGDDPEGCVEAGRLAVEFRQKFRSDVFIEIVCYRKYGHSEGDEPLFTQPKLYQEIQKKKNVRNLYKEHLLTTHELTDQEAQNLEDTFLQELTQAEKDIAELANAKATTCEKKTESFSEKISTAVSEKKLMELATSFCATPQELSIHPKIHKLLQDRLHALHEKKGIDWGLAEYLSYASLLVEGYPVRISGEDSQRGTFAHRHAVVVDQLSEKKYFPLAHLSLDQALFTVYNSHLSEYGVMGFEFGYAQVMQQGLVIWEAQFGDFANGAQIIIDQYVSSCEQKWGINNGLVLFLPHGNEGQGPAHSSARLERFIQMTANANMQIVVPTEPAQMFHLLRSHAIATKKKPLIVFTPKGLLRYQPSLSALKDFTERHFKEVIDDQEHLQANTLILCSGKVYYDLIEEREKRKADHIAIIRIEQLYPWPKDELKKILSQYPHVKNYKFVQEEHRNMGSYEYVLRHAREILPDNARLSYAGRAASASPAAGSLALHNQQKKELLEKAFKNLE